MVCQTARRTSPAAPTSAPVRGRPAAPATSDVATTSAATIAYGSQSAALMLPFSIQPSRKPSTATTAAGTRRNRLEKSTPPICVIEGEVLRVLCTAFRCHTIWQQGGQRPKITQWGDYSLPPKGDR